MNDLHMTEYVQLYRSSPLKTNAGVVKYIIYNLSN